MTLPTLLSAWLRSVDLREYSSARYFESLLLDTLRSLATQPSIERANASGSYLLVRNPDGRVVVALKDTGSSAAIVLEPEEAERMVEDLWRVRKTP